MQSHSFFHISFDANQLNLCLTQNVTWLVILLLAVLISPLRAHAAECADVVVIPNAVPANQTDTYSCSSHISGDGSYSSLNNPNLPAHVCNDRFNEVVAANGGSFTNASRTANMAGTGTCLGTDNNPDKRCAVCISTGNPPACPTGDKYYPSTTRCINDSGEAEPELELGKVCRVSSARPIYFGSGNKLLQAVDFRGTGPLPITWQRTYNSLDGVWRFSYSQHLTELDGSRVRFTGADGRAIDFFKETTGGWISRTNVTETLAYDDINDEWTFTTPSDDVQVFDSAGKLLSITNRAGQSITLGYASGQLDTVTDHAGRVLSISYTGGRIDSITTPDSYIYAYTYDANGMLEAVTYPDDTPVNSNDNPSLTYHYEHVTHNDLVTGITDENGVRLSTYDYDIDRRATLSEMAGSTESTSVTYGTNTATVTNALGKQTDYTFVVKNAIRRVSQIDGVATALCGASVASQTYDANGFVDTRTDENGNVTDLSYDARGLITSKTEGFGTPEARTTTTQWHANFRVPETITKPGQTINMTYDSAGRLLTRTITDTQVQTVPYVTTGNTRVTTYTYNASGLVATIDGPRTDVSDITTYGYDTNGDLKTITNPLSQVIEIISRDGAGRVTAFDDVNDLRTELEYDPRGRLTQRTVKSSQGDVITGFQYDDASLLVQIDLPSGGYVKYEYDNAHRLIAVTNELEERVEYVLDNAGNPTQINYKGPGGALVATQDQLFDELSRLREITDGLSNTTAFDVDLNGNVTDETDALSRVTQQAYDALDQLETLTDADDNDVTLDYDDRGNLISVTDQRNVVTTYVYDGLDNLIQEVSADAGTTTYHYDAAGNLTQQVDARGVVSDYTYDALNRLLTITYPAHTAENVTYQYDVGANALGRLTQITDESGTTSYLFDDRGNVTQDQRVIDGTTYTTQYQYDLSDQITKTTYPSGRVVDAVRDTQSRVASLSQTFNSVTQDLISNQQYDGRGMKTGMIFGNGLYRIADYDLAGRLSTLTLADAYSAAPVAYSDSGNTYVGTPVTLDVLANDADLNGDVLSVFDVSVPSQGSVVINGDQTITYTPSGAAPYVITLTYQATDGAGPSNVANITITVEESPFIDTDGDGLSDAVETALGLDPLDATDTVADADGDGVDNYAEYLAGTDPLVNDSGTAAAILSRSPVAFWKFDETSGSTAADSSGNGRNGTYTSTHTKGADSVIPTGVATAFGGGYLTVPNNAALNYTGDYTLEGLVRWTQDSYGAIYYKIHHAPPYNGIRVTVHGNGSIRLMENNSEYVYSRPGLNDGLWKYITLVRRGNTQEIWINGELDATKTVNTVNRNNSFHLYLMGRNYSGQKLHGDIDQFATHNSALSPSEIKAHFLSLGDKDLDQIPTSWEIAHSHDATDTNDATSDYDGDGSTAYDEYTLGTDPMLHPNGYLDSVLADTPAGYWPLDDTGSTANDASGNGHHGTYTAPYTQSQSAPIASGASVNFTGGWVTVPHHTSLNPHRDFSFELWMRWSTTVKGVGLIKYGTSPLGYWIRPNWTASGTSPGEMQITTSRYSTAHEIDPPLTGLNDDTWRHFVGVRRGSQLELWVDGVLIESKTVPLTPDLSLLTTDLIFAQFDGYTDEVAVYDHALSPGDIRQRLIQGQEPPPVVKAPADQLPNDLDRWLEPGDQIAVRDLRLRTTTTEWFTLDDELSPIANDTIEDDISLDDVVAVVIHDKARTHMYFKQSDGTFKFESVGFAQQAGLKPVASSGLSETWTYAYDAVSNVDSLTKPSGLEDFGYDNLDRLDDYTLPGQSQVTYSYDAVGNRLTESQSGVTQTHTYDTNNNRLTHQSGIQISYDSAGNPLNNGLATQTYTYNAANRQNTVTENSQVIATYTYNALGQRTNKVTTTQDIDFVYDLAGRLLGEYVNGVVFREYVYADGQLLAQGDATTVTYLHTDHLGTPRIATDANGTIVWRWDSDPFGETAPNKDPDGDLNDVTVPLRFPGQYADMETGQYYNYFRTYDPTIGRYAQSDPIGLNGGLNRYTYAYDAPTTNIDPYGLKVPEDDYYCYPGWPECSPSPDTKYWADPKFQNCYAGCQTKRFYSCAPFYRAGQGIGEGVAGLLGKGSTVRKGAGFVGGQIGGGACRWIIYETSCFEECRDQPEQQCMKDD